MVKVLLLVLLVGLLQLVIMQLSGSMGGVLNVVKRQIT